MHGALLLIDIFHHDLSGESCVWMEVWKCDTINIWCVPRKRLGPGICAVGPTLNLSLDAQKMQCTGVFEARKARL